MTMTTLRAAPHIAPGATFQTRTGQLIVTGVDRTVSVDSALVNLSELASAGFGLLVTSGNTAQRPAVAWPGVEFDDTSLNVRVRRNPANTAWLDAGGVVV